MTNTGQGPRSVEVERLLDVFQSGVQADVTVGQDGSADRVLLLSRPRPGLD